MDLEESCGTVRRSGKRPEARLGAERRNTAQDRWPDMVRHYFVTAGRRQKA